MTESEFRTVFEDLTGNKPLRWQERLFHVHFVENNTPQTIDLPTGLGKTMVMAIWLIARAVNNALPRRLIYVVDRRTVVDQATDLATKLKSNAPHALPEFGNLTVSTLRGQLADNREWTRDPSRPAIIVGTVDLIGSRLLFSGYRSSYRQRPLDAGLLGQDSLLVLDEAHLSKPLEKLVTSIAQFQNNQGSPMRVIHMSATSDGSSNNEPLFVLNTDPDSRTYDLKSEPDHETGKERNQIITRFGASKRLTIEKPVDSKKLNDALAHAAIELATNTAIIGKRIVVFVRSPEDAKAIAKTIAEHNKPGKSKANPNPQGPYADSVEVLTGTMRGLERDELTRTTVFKDRWFNGDLAPSDELNQKPVFLISTSAGEVGFDLNADHMVSDQTTIDSFIQRIGRVNRRGTGDATVVLIPRLLLRIEKEGKSQKLSQLEQAIANALDLLAGQSDLSPKSIDSLKKNAWKDRYIDACSPPPAMVELTAILLDAWSMTSITERMPGRPEVAPWIRGIADDLPQTSIVWRSELDVADFDQLNLEDIEEWFDTHGIRTHETLSVPTSTAANWFVGRWSNLTDAQKSVVGARSMVVDRAGLKLVTIKELMTQLARKNSDSIRNADLILPASFGGIERGVGLLDPSAPEKPMDETDAEEGSPNDNGSHDVADEGGRYRELATRNEKGDSDIRSVGSGNKPASPSRFVLEFESGGDTRVQLISYVPKRDKLEWGCNRETLSDHVGLVRKRLDEILSRLDLPETEKRAAQLAAEYHDHGKNRERWQRLVAGAATPPGRKWTDQTIGKSGGVMKRDARHYRHEFGSLREFSDAVTIESFRASIGPDIMRDVVDLALHLIATHHGRGRPHFPKGGFDPDAESRSLGIQAEVIRRFARLQRKYGWWRLAWLENLLRCADALASADPNIEVGDATEASEEAGGSA